MDWTEESRRKSQKWVEGQLEECNGCGIETSGNMLKRFYSSDKYWPKDYTLYDLLVTIEGDDDLTDEFEFIAEYINSIDDDAEVEIVSGVLNYELDQDTKPQLSIREQFLIFCSRVIYLKD